MLRKLFIGLLLLSALTSQGAADKLINALELYTPNSLSNLSGDLNMPENRLQGEEARTMLVSGAFGIGNAILPLDDILKRGNTKSLTFCDLAQDPYINSNVMAQSLELLQYRHPDPAIVSYGSDLSPPLV